MEKPGLVVIWFSGGRAMREKTVEAHLRDEVEKMGGACIKFPPTFFRGFPDRIVLLGKGRIVFVETKAPGKKPKLIQRKVHDWLRDLGMQVEVLDTIAAVDTFLITL